MDKDDSKTPNHTTDRTVLFISGGLLVLFVVLAMIDLSMVEGWINQSFQFSATFFGSYWELLLLANFVIGMVLAISKYGKVRLGKLRKPEHGSYRWIAMILCTLLASGGVFWAASGPLMHFISNPPLFDDNSSALAGVDPALAQSFLHWGFLAWSILGTLATIVLMYVHYHKDYPMKPRGMLYPLFGEKIFHKKSIIGILADVISIVAVAAGTMGPIGFLGLQVGYGMHVLFDIPNTLVTNIIVVSVLVVIAAISVATGIDRGIQFLSKVNVGLTVVLAGCVLILGPTMFIINHFISAEGFHLQNMLTMALYQGNQAWLGAWTVFFWGWFLGYGPMMAIFIARISRGRTIRQLVVAVSIIAPLVTNFWFSVIGGTGIKAELDSPGSISEPLNSGGKPAAVMAIMDQLPLGFYLAIGFLFISLIFVATTVDSISYTVAVSLTGSDEPNRLIRVFWVLMFGLLSIVLLAIGENSVSAIQNAIVVTAVPVSILMLPTLWGTVQVSRKLAVEQQIDSKVKIDK
ncbi:glycine betaine transporter 2 [Paraliobacillus ryukyuensis]|uniref:Choline/carnitine/betaine transport n=1 Tax=Paraliobacillus ryukyuensis TaxID=200904 RepID=A0A366EE87_9BACI|nr:BCCT family transporter [Paraliobacillus ryukyuensis]RBP00633.1 choline/carnitine/betaine transport [Paraliobacillus ryukyuensis]